MRCTSLLLTFSSLLGAGSTAAGQDKTAAASPEAQYKKLLQVFDQAQKVYLKRLQDAAGVAEQGKRFREENPLPAFAPRLLELARKHPDDPVAYASLAWILQNSEFGPAAVQPYEQAVELLASKYVKHKDNEQLFERLATSPFLSSGKLLQAIFEQHPSGPVRGRAGFHWALYLKNYCATVSRLGIDPEMADSVKHFVGPDLFKRLKETDTAAMLRQAEEVLTRVQKNHGLIAYQRTTLGKAAEGELFELRHLMIGKTAPDIEGEDIDGKTFKLSDYRGKVVVLIFWGTWCPHCMAMLPQKRALVKRYEGQPFALVGVNSDEDRAKLKGVQAAKGITWRSFWDGGNSDGPIATRWHVQGFGWPTVYVLDAQGVIRLRQVRGPLLERVVEELMKSPKQ